MPEYQDGQTGTGPPPSDLPAGWDVDQRGDNWTIRDRTVRHALLAEHAADVAECRAFVQSAPSEITPAQMARTLKSTIRLLRALFGELQD